MEALLEFLSGPVFRLAIVVAVLGTAAQYVQNAMVIARSSTDWKKGFRDTISAMITWVNPADRIRRRGFLGELLTWIVLAGVLVVPLFYLGHARLIGRNLFLEWPVVPAQISDLLTKLTMIALVLLLIVRLADHSFRRDMRRLDWMPMILALTAFVSGYLVAHPGRSPMSPDNTALIHYVSADALLLIAPFTRLARCVLLPGAYQGAVQHRQEVAS